jgi:hypothetical protein
MTSSTSTLGAEFGACTKADLGALDRAVAALAKTEVKRDDAKTALGAVMKRLLEKGAQRKAIAERVGFKSDQTVTNMAYGRPGPRR